MKTEQEIRDYLNWKKSLMEVLKGEGFNFNYNKGFKDALEWVLQ